VEQEQNEAEEFPDRRLALMFVCAHPAIDAGVHTALMLQTVLGFEATDIGRCFVVSPTAIAQRLVRAKRKIKDTRIAFVEPERAAMAERLPPVLEAIYGAYALDWLHEGRDMSEEACFLSQLLAELLPSEPEVLGNAALIAYAHSRRDARFREGMLVPLDEQDASLWDASLMSKAEAYLRRASGMQRLGRFQLEAAIQQAQLRGHSIGQTDWRGVLLLSEGLCRMWPSLGAEVSKAVAVAHVAGEAAGLRVLRDLPQASVAGFQPWHAAHAHLLAQLGKTAEAREAYAKAIALTVDAASRKWLEMKRAALG
jgi:RNA polymerase sigma-70 factor (ECF subfamily)